MTIKKGREGSGLQGGVGPGSWGQKILQQVLKMILNEVYSTVI